MAVTLVGTPELGELLGHAQLERRPGRPSSACRSSYGVDGDARSEVRLSTSTRPLASRMRPRGASSATVRTRLAAASTWYWPRRHDLQVPEAGEQRAEQREHDDGRGC